MLFIHVGIGTVALFKTSFGRLVPAVNVISASCWLTLAWQQEFVDDE